MNYCVTCVLNCVLLGFVGDFFSSFMKKTSVENLFRSIMCFDTITIAIHSVFELINVNNILG